MEVYILNTYQHILSPHQRDHSWSFKVAFGRLIAVIIGLTCWLNTGHDFLVLYSILGTQRCIQPTIKARKHMHTRKRKLFPLQKKIISHKHNKYCILVRQFLGRRNCLNWTRTRYLRKLMYHSMSKCQEGGKTRRMSKSLVQKEG